MVIVDGWDLHTDNDFYVRAYNNKLESKRFLVKRYTTSNPRIRIFKILGTPYTVNITRGCTTFSHTLSTSTHTLYFPAEATTEDIVCTALTDDDFILISENTDAPSLF